MKNRTIAGQNACGRVTSSCDLGRPRALSQVRRSVGGLESLSGHLGAGGHAGAAAVIILCIRVKTASQCIAVSVGV